MLARAHRTETAAARLASFLKTVFRKPRRPARPALDLTQLEDRSTPATLRWTGAAGNTWSNAANWAENLNPSNGDRLVFDTTTPGFVSFAPNNDIPGLTGITIAINDSSSGGDFSLSGSAISLATGTNPAVTATVTVGAAAIVNNALVLGANTTVSVGHGQLTLSGGVSGPFALTVASAPSATLRLDTPNAHTGGTVLTSGVTTVNANAALGTGPLTLAGGSLSNVTSFFQLPNAFTVSAPSTITGGGFFQLNGDGVLNATLTSTHAGFLTLAGALSGSGGLATVVSTGSITLSGTAPNTFTGGARVGAGGLTLQKSDGVRAIASPVTIVSGSLTLNANNQLQGTPVAFVPHVTLNENGSFSTNGKSDTVTSLTGYGTLNTGGVGAAGLTVTGGGTQTFSGKAEGNGFLTYTGTGTFTLAGPSSSYTGSLGVGNGTVVVAGDYGGAAVTVTGGTLAGTGVVRSITATGGTVDPGAAGTRGTLNTDDAAAASALNGATFRVDLAAQGPSDRLVIGAGATINLAGATLATNPGAGTLANAYTIVASASGGISGAFNGLPNGTNFNVGGQVYQINYSATAVTLTRSGGGGGRTLHWLGTAGSNWGTASNWAENTTPQSGDTLVFDTGVAGFAGTAAAFAPNNDVAGLVNIGVSINDASAAGDFVIAGNPIGLSTAAGARVTVAVSAGTGARVNNALDLGADTTFAVGQGKLTLGGTVSGGFALAADGSFRSTLLLLANNTYTGGTTLTSGTVSIGENNSLGTGLLTLAGGTLANENSGRTLPNSFVVTATSAIGGGSFFDLDGNGVLNATLRLTHIGFLDLNGALSGPGGVVVDAHPGRPGFGGSAANTFTGGVTLLGGILRLFKTPGVNAIASPIVLGGSSFPNLNLNAADQIADTATVTMDANSTFTLAGFSETIAALNGAGSLLLGSSATNGLTVAGSGASLFTGVVGAVTATTGIVRNAGTGTLTLGGASPDFAGQLVAAGGQLLASANFPNATVLTQGTGTFGGTGVVRSVVATGTGAVNPGAVGVPGILTLVPGANASTLAGQTFRVDINGGGLSDQLVLGNAATINLSGATLNVNLIASTFGTIYPIVSSPSSGITGTFTGLPDDATFVAGGRLFRIDYTASTVTLTDRQSISLSPTTLPTGEVGVAYSQNITPSGGTGATTLALSGVTNTTGLSITGDGTGLITVSGTATTAGTIAFTVTPSDINGPQAPTVYNFTIVPGVVLSPATLPVGQQGLAYSQTITATGGQGTITLAVSGVTNTTGLTIGGTGTGTITISGTPTSAGTVTLTVTPTDAIGTGTGTVYSFNVAAPVVLTPASLPAGEVALAYSQTITSTGGAAPVTLAVSGVTNTTGLTIGGTGTGTITLSGTPTSPGTVSFTVTPTSAAGTTAGTVYSFTVFPVVVLSPATLPGGEQGFAYSEDITATGGNGTINLNVTGVTNTTGLSITGNGTSIISVFGTPTTAGTVTFTVTPTDAIGTGPGKVYTFTVAPQVGLTPANVPDGEVGVVYSETITSTGGSGPVTLALSGVTNTTGLSITGTGTGTITLSGTPTSAGQVTFTVSPTSSVGTSPPSQYTFTINPGVVLSPAALPDGEVGFAYSEAVTATGGVGGITLAVSGVTNTTGLTITGGATVTVTGTPTTAGTVTFTVTPTDQIGTGTGTVYSFDVAPAVTLLPTLLATGEVGFAYNQTLTPVGGTGPVTLALSNVTNPTGLTFTGDGTGAITISGTPTSAGQVLLTVTPTDGFGVGTPISYFFEITPAVVLFPAPNSPLPLAKVGVPYTQVIGASGGFGQISLAVSNVTNASGLTISGDGTGQITVSGTPTSASGAVTFTVTPTDSFGAGTPGVYSFLVAPADVFTPATLPDGRVGTAYTQTITSSAGAGIPLNVSGVTNTTGLTIAGSGTGAITVSGTPTAPGTVTFTVAVASGGPGKVYTFTVAANGVRQFGAGADDGGSPVVTRYSPTGAPIASFDAFPGTTGGVRVAVADFNGDGTPDTAVGTGPGAVAQVRVIDGATGAELFNLQPFADFKGGVFVAAGDITGDGRADLVITPDLSGGPRVTIISGAGFTQVANFFGIDDPAFRGGARAGVGDVNADGFADLVVSAGFGGGPRIAGYDGAALAAGNISTKLFGDFFIFEDTLRNGAYVGVGDVNGDGFADIIGGGGPGGGPRVFVLSGRDLTQNKQEVPLANFFAGNTQNRGGIRVVAKDLDGDALADIVVGDGTGAGSRVTAYLGKDLASATPTFAFDAFPGFNGGVYVG